MHYATPDQIPSDTAHVYLAPHLDDAPLSCGGRIAHQTAAGETVVVLTCCTAAPQPDAVFSPLAQEFHQFWGLAPQAVMRTRLAEEQAAVSALGAATCWGGALDAIYRYPQAYNSRAALFAAPAPDDPLLGQLTALLHRLAARLPQARFYAPLGIGEHVDHLQVFAASAALPPERLEFYEDFPYVLNPQRRAQRLAQIAGQLAELPPVTLSAADLARKIAAIGAYTSQLPELWRGADPAGQMAAAVREYGQRCAPQDAAFGEQRWRRS